jgi:hypothetical protein
LSGASGEPQRDPIQKPAAAVCIGKRLMIMTRTPGGGDPLNNNIRPRVFHVFPQMVRVRREPTVF